jgi:hypothetical protein
MKTKLLGCLAATAMAAAIVAATPAMAFRGGGGFGVGGFHGGFGGGGFGGGGFRGGMVTGRSVFVPGGNRFVGAPFAGRHAFVNRRFSDERRRDRFEDRVEDRFRHRRFFVNRFDNFAFFGVPFAYDYAAYGNDCWRWDSWQWINICYDNGGYNSD